MAPLNTTLKIGAIVGGAAVGLTGGAIARATLPSPETERDLEKQGIHTISHREFIATLAPIAFVAAAAVGTGIGKRSETAAISTASLGAAAMLASTGASAMINADNESADEYLRTLGLMSVVGAGAFAIGAMDEVPLQRAKVIGLVFAGVALGGVLPETGAYIAGIPGELLTSYKHRKDQADSP